MYRLVGFNRSPAQQSFGNLTANNILNKFLQHKYSAFPFSKSYLIDGAATAGAQLRPWRRTTPSLSLASNLPLNRTRTCDSIKYTFSFIPFHCRSWDEFDFDFRIETKRMWIQ